MSDELNANDQNSSTLYILFSVYDAVSATSDVEPMFCRLDSAEVRAQNRHLEYMYILYRVYMVNRILYHVYSKDDCVTLRCYIQY
jgi:hypothetical protein